MLGAGQPPKKAMEYLSALDRQAANDLIRSRIFINCFLELTGGRPFDIDAVCRRDGQLFVAEFKRKYPAANGSFGVDKHLTWLADVLARTAPLYHFILEDLAGAGGKHRDPTTALTDQSVEGPHFRWLGVHLGPGFQAKFSSSLRTSGLDSGQKGGNRKQIAIPKRLFTVLQNGHAQIESSKLPTV